MTNKKKIKKLKIKSNTTHLWVEEAVIPDTNSWLYKATINPKLIIDDLYELFNDYEPKD